VLLRRDFLSWKRVTSGLQRLRNLRLRATLLTACYAILQCGTGIEHFKLRARFLEIVQFRCHKPRLEMTKTELQIALAAATQTNKRTAGVFLDTLSTLAYKAIKKNGEFVLPGFGKLVKQKRKARTGVNPKTLEKIKIPAKTVVKFRVAKVAKDAILGVKK
jgi:DNA-binding protein HU-beta